MNSINQFILVFPMPLLNMPCEGEIEFFLDNEVNYDVLFDTAYIPF
jgi:hypothetical protein